MTIGELIGHLFLAQDVSKAQHWATRNEGRHLALQAFYTGAVPATDRLAETWQGKGKGLITVVRVDNFNMQDVALTPYFTELAQRVEVFKVDVAYDTTLTAILDDILELTYITIDRLGRV